MATVNPCGVEGDVPLVSVAFIPRLRDYSRTGPLRGHSHLTFALSTSMSRTPVTDSHAIGRPQDRSVR
jgi:hypothetical protein